MKFLVVVSSLISVFLFSCLASKPLPEHHITYDEISKKDFIDEKNNINVVHTNLKTNKPKCRRLLYFPEMVPRAPLSIRSLKGAD